VYHPKDMSTKLLVWGPSRPPPPQGTRFILLFSCLPHCKCAVLSSFPAVLTDQKFAPFKSLLFFLHLLFVLQQKLPDRRNIWRRMVICLKRVFKMRPAVLRRNILCSTHSSQSTYSWSATGKTTFFKCLIFLVGFWGSFPSKHLFAFPFIILVLFIIF